MRSLLLTAAILLFCSSFSNDSYQCDENTVTGKLATKNIFGLTVRRLSGERVMITWHTEGESEVIYEVLRKHGKRELFTSLGIVSPESKQDNTADYSFVDTNNFTDSSYYCLKKTNADSVIFYSITKGVEGIGRER